LVQNLLFYVLHKRDYLIFVWRKEGAYIAIEFAPINNYYREIS